MPPKLKSTLSTLRQGRADTPLRHAFKQSHPSSGLKNLSEQRNLKKLSKHKDSPMQQGPNRELIQSLTNLEQQYEQMRSLSRSNKRSLKRSIANFKGVPHTTITLKPKITGSRDSLTDLSLNSTHSRSHSLGQGETGLKVVSIGSLCHQKPAKKKGIHISLKSSIRARQQQS